MKLEKFDQQIEPIEFRSDEKTIQELINYYENDQLNLEPGFQRNTIWLLSDRRKLIDSIIKNYPLPSIFLYETSDEKGNLVYYVLDGKQRLETIFMFTKQKKYKSNSFDVKHELGENKSYCWLDWATIEKKFPEIKAKFLAFKLYTTEVKGGLSDMIDLFVRINSTGKPLTTSEKRKAKFYTDETLKTAQNLVQKKKNYLMNNKILSKIQYDRMKGTELIIEILISIFQQGLIDRKKAVDRAISSRCIDNRSRSRIVKEFMKVLSIIIMMFQKIKETRFHNLSDFYSLFMVIWEMHKEGLILNNTERNAIAEMLLIEFSDGVDKCKENWKKMKKWDDEEELYRRYLLTIRAATDNIGNRRQRHEILKNLLVPLFEKKDEKRAFSTEQRRIIWHSSEEKICEGCGEILTWDDFTMDHTKSMDKGRKNGFRKRGTFM